MLSITLCDQFLTKLHDSNSEYNNSDYSFTSVSISTEHSNNYNENGIIFNKISEQVIDDIFKQIKEKNKELEIETEKNNKAHRVINIISKVKCIGWIFAHISLLLVCRQISYFNIK